MTTAVLEIPPVTLKVDETPWSNKEVTFTVAFPAAAVGGQETKEKFSVYRYENEGYEKFLIWKRTIQSFFEEANLAQRPGEKFKFIARSLMGAAKDRVKEYCQGRNTANQNDYVEVVNRYTKANLPEHPAKATLEYLRERAKLPENM